MLGVSDICKVGVLVIALSAGEAVANKSQDELESVAVTYAELDLSKPAGAEVLYERLQRAAKKVCGFHDRSFSLFSASTKTDKKVCYVDALSRAVAQIDAPPVTGQHEG